jgi:DNA-binding protein
MNKATRGVVRMDKGNINFPFDAPKLPKNRILNNIQYENVQLATAVLSWADRAGLVDSIERRTIVH